MGYQRGKTTQPAGSLLSVEQARRKNAELRLELVALTAEKPQLESQVEAMRQEITTARRKLSRQIRDLEAIRTQIRNIAALAEHASGTEPVFGGREGLQAATAEIRAHEDQHAKPSRPATSTRRRKGRSHGTAGKYVEGCRCDECKGWRGRKSAQEREHVKRRREQEIAEALRAHAEKAAA